MTEHLTASEDLLLHCGWLAHEANDKQTADILYRQAEDIWMNGNATDMYEHYLKMKVELKTQPMQATLQI